MSQAKSKRTPPARRICVLVRGQEWEPGLPGRACLSRIHGHLTYEKAAALVEDGLAEWVTAEKQTRNKVLRVTVAAIRLIPRRRWKGKISSGDGRPMKVLQLVR